MEQTEKFKRESTLYKKNFPDELTAVLVNLERYFKTLQNLGNPLRINAGFIHNEPSGIKAIDQKGGCRRGKLRQTRLYLFPDQTTRTLYLLAIGDKKSQRRDIEMCRKEVSRIKKGNYADGGENSQRQGTA